MPTPPPGEATKSNFLPATVVCASVLLSALAADCADLNAADITGGASNYAGCVIYCFARDTDTDEDAGLVRKGDFDTVAQGAVTGMGGLTAGTYAFYAAFKDAAGNIGPWSARSTLAIT